MRTLVATMVAFSVLMPAAPAAATHDGAPEPEVATYAMVFPLVGSNYYSNTWHAPRSGGRVHLGTDIMADKMIPVVAVADGTVGWMHDTVGGKCCAMSLSHDDGWESYYIHLNNDTPGTDDGLGWGFAPGIERGVHVTAGQLIGYVGDSGNAEGTAPHVHYELHHPSYGPINPYPHLRAAMVLGTPGALDADPPCPPAGACDSVALVSDEAVFDIMNEIRWNAGGPSFFYGNPGDVPLMGDWDCDGEATPAMYRRESGFMYLRNSNNSGSADIDFFYGDVGDTPLAGDFNGDGCDTLGIYRAAEATFHIKNTLEAGPADSEFMFGNPGDKPFVGDFDGDGIDTMGLHRETTGFVYFRDSNDTGIADSEFFYGDPGDKILAGDWDGDGDDTVGVYRPSTGVLYLKLANTAGYADYQVPVGTDLVGVLTAPSRPGMTVGTERTEDLESCLLATVSDARTYRTLRGHPATGEQAALVAVDTASGRDPNSFARAYDARVALQDQMGITYYSEGRTGTSAPTCAALTSAFLTDPSPARSFLMAEHNVFIGLSIVIVDEGGVETAYVGMVMVRDRGKYYYETELGRSLTDAEYELLVTEGIGTLSDP